MEGHISPVSSADEADEAEIAAILQDELQFDEVDIGIHFHCEHCIKLSACKVWPKEGWSCEIITCPHYCTMRFHKCKLSEHELLCSHKRVACLNASFGCPHSMPRYTIPAHLPQCPASVVVCGCERNRWLVDTLAREITAPRKKYMEHFNPTDLDVSLALYDQALLNQLAGAPSLSFRPSATNRRYPVLPLHSPLTGEGGMGSTVRSDRSPSLATDEEDLVPGLSGSVCAKLRDGQKSEAKGGKVDDFYMGMCAHCVHRSGCRLCKDDVPPPAVQMKTVWRQEPRPDSPAGQQGEQLQWVQRQRVARVRRRGVFDTFSFCKVDDNEDESAPDQRNLSSLSAQLVPSQLRMQLIFDTYSKHQVKPRNMITVQCLQVVRRDEYSAHYEVVHCDVLGEGLQGGLLLTRCPLHQYGCPHSQLTRTAGTQGAEVTFSPLLQAFGLRPRVAQEQDWRDDVGAASDGGVGVAAPTGLLMPTPLFPNPRSPSPTPRPSPCRLLINSRDASPAPLLAPAAPRLTSLPLELLLHILSFLDGFSLSQVSLSCRMLADACAGLVRGRGLVLQHWSQRGGRWVTGTPRWVFSSCCGSVSTWRVADDRPAMADHMRVCQYYDRNVAQDKFTYGPIREVRSLRS